MTVASGATEQTAMPSTPPAAAYGAAAWATVFGVLHFYWALGGSVGLGFATGAEAEDAALQRDPTFVLLGLWGVGALCFHSGGNLACGAQTASVETPSLGAPLGSRRSDGAPARTGIVRVRRKRRRRGIR